MNAEMQVLQTLDAAQAALKRLPGLPAQERARTAHAALHQILAAPWSPATRPEEVEQHDWLAQMREALQRIEREPESGEVERLTGEGPHLHPLRGYPRGYPTANELERDMRRLLGAR